MYITTIIFKKRGHEREREQGGFVGNGRDRND